MQIIFLKTEVVNAPFLLPHKFFDVAIVECIRNRGSAGWGSAFPRAQRHLQGTLLDSGRAGMRRHIPHFLNGPWARDCISASDSVRRIFQHFSESYRICNFFAPLQTPTFQNLHYNLFRNRFANFWLSLNLMNNSVFNSETICKFYRICAQNRLLFAEFLTEFRVWSGALVHLHNVFRAVSVQIAPFLPSLFTYSDSLRNSWIFPHRYPQICKIGRASEITSLVVNFHSLPQPSRFLEIRKLRLSRISEANLSHVKFFFANSCNSSFKFVNCS